MRATIMCEAGDVRVENVPYATLVEATDAIIRVSRGCICGSDLWLYKLLGPTTGVLPMGHEAIGVIPLTPPRLQCIEDLAIADNLSKALRESHEIQRLTSAGFHNHADRGRKESGKTRMRGHSSSPLLWQLEYPH